MMVPIQVIRWYRMQCYDGTDSCAIVVPNRRYCQIIELSASQLMEINGGGMKDKIVKCFVSLLADYLVGTPDDLKQGYNDGLKRK